ncbi:hypothetical protein [Bradyrhizobium sp. RT7b]|uniref:hypothetical protein n=1 Tax=unclassified Bradyrhizobium TaxID=2631580 RepID=UPI0033937532
MAGFAPLFEQIGQQLDTAIAEPNLDRYFAADSAQIVVAISDLGWRGATLFAAYAGDDIEPLAARAQSVIVASIADLERAGRPTTPADCLVTIWSEWGRAARKRVRTGAAALDASPDVQVGSLLACFPHVRRELTEIASKGSAVPVLVVGLSSPTGADRRKWKLRAAACALPKWSLSSGAVAGRA